ncbi:MAG: YlxR family protein [Actinomycetia bacterium]|nr:YlxR family protein [Actinomycetes bacterium]
MAVRKATTHEAWRSCIACRRQAPKPALVRIVCDAEHTVRIDPGGRVAGRGAYLCKCSECFANARRKRRLEQALRLSIADNVYERLGREFSDLCCLNMEEDRIDG